MEEKYLGIRQLLVLVVRCCGQKPMYDLHEYIAIAVVAPTRSDGSSYSGTSRVLPYEKADFGDGPAQVRP